MREDIKDLTFEVNPNHPLMAQLNHLRKADTNKAAFIIKQIFDNCCVEAGIPMPPQELNRRVYKLLEMVMSQGK
jgi:HSP90 family molecular chaperone